MICKALNESKYSWTVVVGASKECRCVQGVRSGQCLVSFHRGPSPSARQQLVHPGSLGVGSQRRGGASLHRGCGRTGSGVGVGGVGGREEEAVGEEEEEGVEGGRVEGGGGDQAASHFEATAPVRGGGGDPLAREDGGHVLVLEGPEEEGAGEEGGRGGGRAGGRAGKGHSGCFPECPQARIVDRPAGEGREEGLSCREGGERLHEGEDAGVAGGRGPGKGFLDLARVRVDGETLGRKGGGVSGVRARASE